MRIGAVAKLLTNRRDPNYLLAWGVLACAIVLVIFLAMQLWIDSAIAAAAVGFCLFFMRYPRFPSLDEIEKEFDDEEGGE